MFTGREWNQSFGFYEYRARAYHPDLGRFMSEDPKGFEAGDYNLYRYCHNDPVDCTDPTGLLTDNAQQVASVQEQQNDQGSTTIPDAVAQSARDFSAAIAAHHVENMLLSSLGAKSAVWQSLHPNGLTVAQTVQNSKSQPNYIITRTTNGPFRQQGLHGPMAVMRWYFTLTSPSNLPVAYQMINEHIEFKNGVDVAPKGHDVGHKTNEFGHATDDWRIPFTSNRGHVDIVQDLFVGDAKGTWTARVGANLSLSSEDTMELR